MPPPPALPPAPPRPRLGHEAVPQSKHVFVQLRRLLASAQVEGLQVVVLVEHEVGAPVAVDEAAHVEDGGA